LSANSQKWDELWKNNPFTVYTDSRITRWANRVKRIGDRFIKKADKYDALVRLIQTNPQMNYDDVGAVRSEIDEIIGDDNS